MKLIITLLLASMLVMEVQASPAANDATCTTNLGCSDTNAGCAMDNAKCLCNTDFANDGIGGTCKTVNGKTCTVALGCNDAKSECINDGTSDTSVKCFCKPNYQVASDGTCKKAGGQACTEATKAICASAKCSASKCEGAIADGTACRKDEECKSSNCSATDKKCVSGANAVTASLILMVVTLVTSRFL